MSKSKPLVNKMWENPKIPLRWDRKGDLKLIGWYYPKVDVVTTPKGRVSVNSRLNTNGKINDNRNLMHMRRSLAARKAKDFIYHGE